MSSSVFFDRRQENKSGNFKNRRGAERRSRAANPSKEQRRAASQVRRQNRESLKIPVKLQADGKEFVGHTEDLGLGGLRIFAGFDLSETAPMTLKFSFGENICQLNISGQVAFCRSTENGKAPRQAIGIKFSAVTDFEQKIISAAVKALQQDSSLRERSSLSIHVSNNVGGLTQPTGENIHKKNRTPHSFEMQLDSDSINQLDSLSSFLGRRRFELPVSFPNRRKEPRRKKRLSVQQEKRRIEKEKGEFESLKESIILTNRTHREGIKMILGQISGIDPKAVDESTEIRSLGLDSFQLIEMMAGIETVYNMTIDDGAILRIITIRDLVNLIGHRQD